MLVLAVFFLLISSLVSTAQHVGISPIESEFLWLKRKVNGN